MSEDVEDGIQLEPLLNTMARVFASEGAAIEVSLLANSTADLNLWDISEQDNGYDSIAVGIYQLVLQIPHWLYSQISTKLSGCEMRLKTKANELLRGQSDYIRDVCITTTMSATGDWRDKAKRWVTGEGVTNQGRVRSDNIPSKTADGLLFRSQNEIFFYKALKSLGVSFAPLPVFVRGGDTYRRIEPDFVIIKSGVVLVVEVDGDTVHHETPAEATDRTRMLAHEGVHIERVKASECATQELANDCAKRIVQIIEKLKAAR